MKRGPIEGGKCENCPLANVGNKPNNPVPGAGPNDPDFIIIAETPGANEVRQGRPLVGKSGQLVDKILKLAGSDRSRVYCTYAAICMPDKDLDEKIRLKAARCCKARLKEELRQFPGKHILTMGGTAYKSVVGGKFSITQACGSYNLKDIDGTGKRVIIPTFHPAYVLHSQDSKIDTLIFTISYDTAKLVKHISGELKYEDQDNIIKIEIESPQKASRLIKDFVKHAKEKGEFACDTETVGVQRWVEDIDGNVILHKHTALEAYYARMTAIGLATEDYGISVMWRLVTPRMRLLLKELFADSTLKCTFHNQLYDRPVLHQHGIEVKGEVFDTLLGHHNAFPGMVHKLQAVTSQFFLVPPWKSEYRSSQESDEEHCIYCAKDTYNTAKLKAPLIGKIVGEADEPFEMDQKMADIAYKMHLAGVPISREANRELRDKFLPAIEKREKLFNEFFEDSDCRDLFFTRLAMEMAKLRRASKTRIDPEDIYERIEIRKKELAERFESGKFKFSPRYYQHVSSYLLASGVNLNKLTKSGGISTDKEVLESMAHHDEVRNILDYRKVATLYATFVEKMQLYMDENGLIHPNWSVNKNTGRWGSTNPMIQNWTVGSEEDKNFPIPNIRRQVVAPEGYVIVGSDFKALEARIIGLYSGDPYIVDTFANNEDIHVNVASAGLPGFDELEYKSEEWNKFRGLAKTLEYGFFYNASDQKLHQTIVKNKEFSHVKLGHVSKFSALLRKKMPRVKDFHNWLFKEVATKKMLVAPIGNRRWMFPMGLTDPNFVTNWLIQTSGASIMAKGLLKLVNRLPSHSWPIIQLHDAIYVLCPEDKADKIAKLVDDSLTQEYTISGATMLFPTDTKIGKSWGDLG